MTDFSWLISLLSMDFSTIMDRGGYVCLAITLHHQLAKKRSNKTNMIEKNK